MFDCVEPGGGKQTGLPHTTPEALTPYSGSFNVISSSGEDASDGCAKGFAETQADAVNVVCELADGPVKGGAGVPQSCPIEVDSDAEFVCGLAKFRMLVWTQN